MAASVLTVHSSLSSVLAALSTEWDQLRDLHQGSEPSRMGVRLGGRVASGRRGLEAEDCSPGNDSRFRLGESSWQRQSLQRSAWQGRRASSFRRPVPAGL